MIRYIRATLYVGAGGGGKKVTNETRSLTAEQYTHVTPVVT